MERFSDRGSIPLISIYWYPRQRCKPLILKGFNVATARKNNKRAFSFFWRKGSFCMLLLVLANSNCDIFIALRVTCILF